MSLHHIKNFIQQGEYEEALREIQELPIGDELAGKVLKSRILRIQGDYFSALSLSSEALKESKEKNNKVLELAAYVEKAYTLQRLGRTEDAFKVLKQGEFLIQHYRENKNDEFMQWEACFYNVKGLTYWDKEDYTNSLVFFKKSIRIFNTLGDTEATSRGYNNIGAIYWKNNQLDLALENYQNALVILGEKTEKEVVGLILNNIGIIYREKGLFELAIDYFSRAQGIFEKIGNNQFIALSRNNTGNIYIQQGLLDEALEYHQEALTLREDLGNENNIATSLLSIAKIYRQKGDVILSIDYFEQVLKIREGQEVPSNTSITLFYLVLSSLEINDTNRAKKYLQKISELNDQSKASQMRKKLAIAISLKNSPGIKQKVEAQKILQEIVDGKIWDYELSIIAMIQLCQLLLVELHLYKEEEVLEEVDRLLKKIHDIARMQASFTIEVESLLLQAKLSLISGNIIGAELMLEQAHLIAEERGLLRLYHLVTFEKSLMQGEISKWSQLIQNEGSLLARIEKSHIL
ncbi:MAG: tetratricopeptide repeat protein, partial [Candidatus Kariarchaeaceae archaeon]